MTTIFAKQKHTSHITILATIVLWLLAILMLFFFGSARQPDIKIAPIVLKAEPLSFTPKEFYIANVIDERQDRKAVAYLLPVATPGITPPATTQAVDLQGGGLAGIKAFFKQSLPSNTKLRPITIRIKECQVIEKPGDKGRVEGKVTVHLAFDYQRDGIYIRLDEYRGGARYMRIANQHTVVEPTLRRAITDALVYLNTWMDREADRNDKLANTLKVNFTDYTHNVADDTLFYTPNRPLTWEDFKATPRTSPFAAAVFPGFAYEGSSDVVKGSIVVNLKMKVYVIRSSSWVKAAARDAYSLNHEQRHFDIVKLVAERFKQKIKPENLTLEDYNSIIQYQYIESFREMNRLQKQYDDETGHGTNHVSQEYWNQKIDEELTKFAIKK